MISFARHFKYADRSPKFNIELGKKKESHVKYN